MNEKFKRKLEILLSDIESFFTDLILPIATVIVILGIFVLIISDKENKRQEEIWNNGQCINCEVGHYIYDQAVGHRYSTDYIYKCDNCGWRIEINTIR